MQQRSMENIELYGVSYMYICSEIIIYILIKNENLAQHIHYISVYHMSNKFNYKCKLIYLE